MTASYDESADITKDVVETRFTVAIGVDMARDYTGDELVDRTVNRYVEDDAVMAFYDNDEDALRKDIEEHVETYPDQIKDHIAGDQKGRRPIQDILETLRP